MAERITTVLSDVDATQIIPGQRLPSAEVQAAAHKLRAHSVPLLEVTSRPHALMRKLVEPLDLRDNLCTLDGGATVARADSGEVVWSQWLSGEQTQAVVLGIGQLCTGVYYDEESRGRKPADVLTAIQNGSTTIEGAPAVFAVFGVDRAEKIVRTLAGLAGVQHTPVMTYDNLPDLRCIQVARTGVDKQYGIEQMLSYAGLADERLLVIGDGTNDISLFAAAGPEGIKVAMGNASEELKDLADWVAPSVEEHGFAATMDRYVFLS